MDDQDGGGEMGPVDASVSVPLAPELFVFTGRAGEYFRIWIVNLALTMVTVGIYSAWAKVRTRRYFYGNTVLAGHPFDYHASPIAILIGRLIVFGVLVLYQAGSAFSLIVSGGGALVLAVLYPWIVCRSLRFNARVSSYRNVRFDFVGTYWGAAKAFLLWPLAIVLSLGLLLPYVARRMRLYVANNHRFGGRPFVSGSTVGSVYLLFLMALGLVVAMLVIARIAVPLLMPDFLPMTQPGAAAGEGAVDMTPAEMLSKMGMIWLFPLVGAVAFYAIAAFVAAGLRNLVYGHLVLDGQHRFASRLSRIRWVWVVMSNRVLSMASLGLLIPWSKVREARVLAASLTLLPATDLSDFIDVAPQEGTAAPAEFADLQGFDIGI